jgi:hypothetical protein
VLSQPFAEAGHSGDEMKNLTRGRLIQLWFAVVVLVVVGLVAFSAAMTLGTAMILLALSLVPPAIVLMLWPGDQPLTAAEVLHGARPHSND